MSGSNLQPPPILTSTQRSEQNLGSGPVSTRNTGVVGRVRSKPKHTTDLVTTVPKATKPSTSKVSHSFHSELQSVPGLSSIPQPSRSVHRPIHDISPPLRPSSAHTARSDYHCRPMELELMSEFSQLKAEISELKSQISALQVREAEGPTLVGSVANQLVSAQDVLSVASEDVESVQSAEDDNCQTQSRDFRYKAIELLADNMARTSMPNPEPRKFVGDPLDYHRWNREFLAMIARVKSLTEGDKLYYLCRSLDGEALKDIDGFESSEMSDTYPQAKALIDQRYGHPFLVAEAYKTRLKAWPKLAKNDDKGLRKLSDYLLKCRAAKRYLTDLQILDDTSYNQQILTLLPAHIITRWNEKVQKYKAVNGKFPPFDFFADFLREQADNALDPVTSLGAIQRLSRPSEQKVYKTFSHSVVENPPFFHVEQSACPVCTGGHWIHQCAQFKELSVADRRVKARLLKLCYLCLKPGHRSDTCSTSLKCNVCQRNHHRLLHSATQYNTNQEKSATEISHCSRVEVNQLHHDSGRSRMSSMIVPVWVSSRANSGVKTLTYAMLDSQSTTSFITEDLADKVSGESVPTKLKMSTMTCINKELKCRKVLDLTVHGYDGSEIIHLPPTFTRSLIPHNIDHLPNPEVPKAWGHLKEMSSSIPKLDSCAVGLLIGYNCSRALLPLQVISGETNEPFAVQTPLGWSVVGGALCDLSKDVDEVGYSHRVICCEVPSEIRARNTNQVYLSHKSDVVETKSNATEVLQPLEGDISRPGDENQETYSQEDHEFLFQDDASRKGPILFSGRRSRLLYYAGEYLPFKRSYVVQRFKFLQKIFFFLLMLLFLTPNDLLLSVVRVLFYLRPAST